MITSPQELGDWLRLMLVPDIGARTLRRLLSTWPDPRQIFEQDERALCQVLPPRQAHALLTEPPGWAALQDRTWRWLQDSLPGTPLAGVPRAIVTLGDPDYPAPLLEMPDPPLMLHALGQTTALPRLDIATSLAIVGSRNPTPQGQINARAFAHHLAARGLTVVSGLALGVDGAAHEGALEGSSAQALATVAVVGTGLDRVYPRQHLALAQQVAQRGLILSEYPLGTPPLRANFPQRNRIISGLAQGTLVVEAALHSGSLITAREALEQGREVFAIPGSIHSALSRGCHALIREGAKLVESAEDVLEELRQPELFAATDEAPPPAKAQAQGVHEDPLLRALGHDPVSLDALQARCGLDTASLQAQLLELELGGQVTRLASGLFQRVGQA